MIFGHRRHNKPCQHLLEENTKPEGLELLQRNLSENHLSKLWNHNHQRRELLNVCREKSGFFGPHSESGTVKDLRGSKEAKGAHFITLKEFNNSEWRNQTTLSPPEPRSCHFFQNANQESQVIPTANYQK